MVPVTTGREEVGSEASTRVRRAAAAALAGAAFLVGAAVAMADPGTGTAASAADQRVEFAGNHPEHIDPAVRQHATAAGSGPEGQRPEAWADRADVEACQPIRYRRRVRAPRASGALPGRANQDEAQPAHRHAHRPVRSSDAAGRPDRARHEALLLRGLHAGRARKLGEPRDAPRREQGRRHRARRRVGAHREGRPGRRRQAGVDEPARRSERSGRTRAGHDVPAVPVRRHADRNAPSARVRGRLRAARRPARPAMGSSPSTRRATDRRS